MENMQSLHRKGPCWDLNQRRSCCETMALTALNANQCTSILTVPLRVSAEGMQVHSSLTQRHRRTVSRPVIPIWSYRNGNAITTCLLCE